MGEPKGRNALSFFVHTAPFSARLRAWQDVRNDETRKKIHFKRIHHLEVHFLENIAASSHLDTWRGKLDVDCRVQASKRSTDSSASWRQVESADPVRELSLSTLSFRNS